jgi:hypothetical protein
MALRHQGYRKLPALDQESVGGLVKLAVDAGRQERPSLDVGICGELSYDLSPIARLAAAEGVEKVDLPIETSE